MKAVGRPVEQLAETGAVPILVETTISYRKPLRLGDSARGEIWISELTNASAWVEFRFYDGKGELAASGRQRGIFIDLESGRPKRLPAEERDLFAPYVIREEPTAGETRRV